MTLDWTTQENDWGLICFQTGSTRADWVHLADNSTSGKTLGAAGTTTYYYTAFDRTFTNSNAGGSGLTILGTVYLYIPSGKTITCTGHNASGATGGGAGIELTEGNTLYLIGSGSLVATGGNAANGGNGAGGGDASTDQMHWVWSGAGGRGGAAEVAMAAAVPVQASARAVPMVALAVPVAQQYKRNTIVHRQQAMWVAMARTAVRLPRWARSIYMMAPRLSPPRQIFMEVARAQPAAMEVPGAAML